MTERTRLPESERVLWSRLLELCVVYMSSSVGEVCLLSKQQVVREFRHWVMQKCQRAETKRLTKFTSFAAALYRTPLHITKPGGLWITTASFRCHDTRPHLVFVFRCCNSIVERLRVMKLRTCTAQDKFVEFRVFRFCDCCSLLTPV